MKIFLKQIRMLIPARRLNKIMHSNIYLALLSVAFEKGECTRTMDQQTKFLLQDLHEKAVKQNTLTWKSG